MRGSCLTDRWTKDGTTGFTTGGAVCLVAAAALLLASQVQAQASPPFLSLPGPGYVEVAHDPALNPSSAITVEAWVYMTSFTSYQGAWCMSLIGKGWHESYWLGLCDGRPRFYTNGSPAIDASSAVELTDWVHVAATYDGTTVRFYIDGVAAGTSTAISGPPTASAAPLRIGSDSSYDETPPGFIDEVRLWSVARTETDIAMDMNTAIDSPQAGLIAAWPLNIDASDPIGHHDGTLHGDAAFVSDIFGGCTFETFVAAGGHLPGSGSTQWVTDLSLLNPYLDPVTTTVYLLARDQDNSSAPSTTVTISPGASALLADVVLDRFGESNLAAALRICSDVGLIVSSRTYNQGATGTYGQGIPGVPSGNGLIPGMDGFATGLHENASFRTNVGFTNLSPVSATVTVELIDADGTFLGLREYTLPPYGHIQRGRIFAEVTSDAITNGSLRVISSGGSILAYASVVDNVTGDPTYIAVR